MAGPGSRTSVTMAKMVDPNSPAVANANSAIASGRRRGSRWGLRSRNGQKNSTAKNAAGSTTVPTTSYGPSKYFNNRNKNMKYHSGRASKAWEGSASAPSGAGR